MNVNWATIKAFSDQKGIPIQSLRVVDTYHLWAYSGPMEVTAQLEITDPANDDQIVFETSYKAAGDAILQHNVTTAMEKNDKTLRSFCAWADTDINGQAEFCIPVPGDGRWIAYGDIEFNERHFGDHLSVLEITDLDRNIAMQMAVGMDPSATEPLSDETVRENGFPLYPVVGHYDERGFPDPLPANSKGTIKGGMTMDFKYGVTEAQPVGGYGFIPGYLYLRICGQKADGQTTGHSCQLSIDWAENG